MKYVGSGGVSALGGGKCGGVLSVIRKMNGGK
jgi:hypothetical protein